MAYAFVKTWQNSANSNVVSGTSPTNSGDLLVLFSRTSAGGGSPTITSVTDNLSSTWQSALATTNITSGSLNYQTIYFLPNASSSITSITCTYNGGTPGSTNILLAEYSGIATSSPLIGITAPNTQVTPGLGTNAIVSPTFNVTSGVPALIMGLVANGGDGTTVAGTGYTGRVLVDAVFFLQDLRATTTGNQTSQCTDASHGNTDTYTSYLLAFSEPAGSPSASIAWVRA